jgi:hypothetical protein
MTEERSQAVKERPEERQDQREDAQAAGSKQTALFDPETASRHQDRWREIQSQFVDDPHSAVESADELVAQVTKELTRTFAKERERLEKEWSADGDPSTEDLRVALQRYRSFFGRLLEL